MTRFREKPVEIDALQNTGSLQPMIDWFATLVIENRIRVAPTVTRNRDGSLIIEFPRYTVTCVLNDWVTCINGQVSPCASDVFNLIYEPVV